LIPLRDTIPAQRFPVVNYALIGLCTWAFLVELGSGPRLEEMIHAWGLIPARFLALGDRVGFFEPVLWAPFVGSTFLHGGWSHFLGNMLYLWIFGDNVEDRMGHAGYLGFYLLGGLFAGMTHVAFNPASVVPTIGASGAIAAVMGAYLILFPGSRIVSVVFVFFWIQLIAVPAVFYLAFWFVIQLVSGSFALAGAAQGGVAWWAHAGGFAFGAASVLVLGLRAPPRGGH
jgi:membrane associated rhomboid family serine protease